MNVMLILVHFPLFVIRSVGTMSIFRYYFSEWYSYVYPEIGRKSKITLRWM